MIYPRNMKSFTCLKYVIITVIILWGDYYGFYLKLSKKKPTILNHMS